MVRGGNQTNSFTTFNLRKHLKVRHPDKFGTLISSELEETEKAAKKSADSSQNQSTSTVITLDDCFERSRPYPVGHPIARKITRLIGEVVVVDCQPFSIMEDEGFVHQVKELQPCYQIPS